MTPEQLEEDVKGLQTVSAALGGSKLVDIDLNGLRALVAWEMHKDGAPWEMVEEIYTGEHPDFQSEEDCIRALNSVFNYKGEV